MTDEASRLARLEERMQDVETWIDRNSGLGTDVTLLKKCIETYNGDMKDIKKLVLQTHDTVHGWGGGLALLKWAVGGLGVMVVVQTVLGAIGL